MAKYRNNLPQQDGRYFLADGGIETTLIYHEGLDLPLFAAFPLLSTAEGEAMLNKYFRTYAQLAARLGVGVILESPTWRASPDWAAKLGYGAPALDEANQKAIRLLEALRPEFETPQTPVVISGCVGPRGDGYVPNSAMTADQAANYHRAQIEAFADAGADLVSAITMNYAEEAVGVVHAARAASMSVVVSLTVETDGRLPAGQPLSEAIHQVDGATSGYAAYFMLNCAHPSHFDAVLRSSEPWLSRIRGLRTNASRLSHAELNEATELDAGDPEELGREHARLLRSGLRANVFGGCCGTDHRHVEQIAKACLPIVGGK